MRVRFPMKCKIDGRDPKEGYKEVLRRYYYKTIIIMLYVISYYNTISIIFFPTRNS